MEKKIFHDFDLTAFWKDSDYARKRYISEPLTDDLIAGIEQELGYKLPASYIELMHSQNGGIPVHNGFRTTEVTTWGGKHIEIAGILGLGRTKAYSVCGHSGSKFMIDDWGYPALGVYICTSPSAGHDMVLLDYSQCGKDGEPQVVHVDQESDYKVTFVAKDFETFVRGLTTLD
ncbi:SMI1/KNR4 family protein [Chryseolinea lacunae]|uniref:SMI1/KNR4 family protein n=1 Tax=Chryseolinea lacunae TaxID=2801331 RepID=A0ABS1KY95_9BACT|nr:SMI1/KNR4 family protein [Chryseolinea lacunae]MBL0744421.1 SMI1/KNR4 family protein [Chryseolinea lacunae]